VASRKTERAGFALRTLRAGGPRSLIRRFVAGERLAKAQSSGPEVLKEPRVSEGRESRADPTA